LFPALSLALLLLWARSTWTVDKIWVQVLQHGMLDLQLAPGQLIMGYAASNVSLPIGESGWSTWHADSYYGDYILRPTKPLFGEFGFLDGKLLIPIWFLAFLSAVASIIVYAWTPNSRKVVAEINESTAGSKALLGLPSRVAKQPSAWLVPTSAA
jgi:hypothetical protein